MEKGQKFEEALENAATSVADFDTDDNLPGIIITATCSVTGPTGVEMEAMTAVSVSSLTIYDMCKSFDKEIIISNIRLIYKRGGKSGKYKSDKIYKSS